MSSNKNLKVYKMLFITQLGKLTMNVKFACKMKVTWKRSNESAESTWMPLEGGVAQFDQILKLAVNMYFDTVKNKFVEKKCLYSFVISTEKGEKSAGSITVDLAQFFNKRLYCILHNNLEMNQAFTLDKCPVAGTKIQMKIHYEEDATEQQGYDSMSCISSTNTPMDTSTASMDLSQLNPGSSNISETSQNETERQKSEQSDLSTSKTEKQPKKIQQQRYTRLDASDVVDYPSGRDYDGNKISQNIRSINIVTAKINQFVADKSKNIKYEIQEQKRKIVKLEEDIQGEKILRQKIEKQLQEEKKKSTEVQRQLVDFKVDAENQIESQKKKITQLQEKSNSTQKLINKMESKLSQEGQSQNTYIEHIKANFEGTQKRLNGQLEETKAALTQEKKARNQVTIQLAQLQGSLNEMRQKYSQLLDKNTQMEENMRRKEEELQGTRISLEKAYENLVEALGKIV